MLAAMQPTEVTVRTATATDNDAVIALELRSALVLGDVEELFDRSPDAMACCRVHDGCRVIVAEMEGRVVGLMAGVVFRPEIQGQRRTLVYIHRARVDPDYHHRGVAMALSTDLFAWSAKHGCEGPCYAIAPENATSLSFVERGGGRWPRDLAMLDIDVSEAAPRTAEPITEEHLPAAVDLINAAHAGEDFFEPLTLDSLRGRLTRDPLYSIANLRGVFDGGTLVAVAGLLDKGSHTARIRIDRATSKETRTRSAAVADWGYAPGREDAFTELLACLAAETRALGRTSLTICEPRPGSLALELPHRRSAVSLFTPSLPPPAGAAIRGLYFDLLNF
jgi:GNAT superfamily N-acetyltransferase